MNDINFNGSQHPQSVAVFCAALQGALTDTTISLPNAIQIATMAVALSCSETSGEIDFKRLMEKYYDTETRSRLGEGSSDPA